MTFSRCEHCQHLLYAFDGWACAEAGKYIAEIDKCPLWVAANRGRVSGR